MNFLEELEEQLNTCITKEKTCMDSYLHQHNKHNALIWRTRIELLKKIINLYKNTHSK